MSGPMNGMPLRLQEIVEEFSLAEGREKLEYLLEFSESLPPLPGWLQDQRNKMEQVHECMTPVFVYVEASDGRLTFHLDVPPESPTVRGYAAILSEGLRGATPAQVLNVPDDFYRQMGLQDVLSSQRLNGITAILAHLKELSKSVS
ncbi:MAG: SufE family protein [Chloroflexota bacterium]